MKTVTHFQREDLARVRCERLQLLLLKHWNEIARYKDIPLSVDWARYEHAERHGVLRIYTARHQHQLIGYACYFVDFAPHYRTSKQAIQDVLFLTPEYRRARIGADLVAFADTMLRGEGVQLTIQHSKLSHPIDPLLVRQGYELVEHILMKRLDQKP